MHFSDVELTAKEEMPVIEWQTSKVAFMQIQTPKEMQGSGW